MAKNKYNKDWYERNKDRLSKKRKAQRKMTRNEIARKYNLKRSFNITPEDYDNLLLQQKGVCAICNNIETVVDAKTKLPKRLSVDHNHVTGTVRGLLCNACNYIIGACKENVRTLQAAINYIRYHNNELLPVENNSSLVIDWEEYQKDTDKSTNPIKFLNPGMPTEIVENDLGFPTGKGRIIGVIDYGPEDHLLWIVIMDDSRQVWQVPNPYIRAQHNPSMGRK